MSNTYISKGPSHFPSRDVPEQEKDKPVYNSEYCKAIYSRYVHDKCGIRYSNQDNMDLMRLYGKGSQPPSIYKSFYDKTSNDSDNGSSLSNNRGSKSREGWENIQMRIISPLPRIKSIIKGYMDQVGQDVFVDTLDPLSNDIKENMKWKMFTMMQNYEFINEYHLKSGIPMEDLEFLPVNQVELNLFEAMGGFKLNWARAMEKLISHTEEISDLNEELRDRWIDDALDIGVVAARVRYDHRIKKYKYEYMDPKYTVIQYVRSYEYDRSEWGGYLEMYTISELKQLLPDKEEDWFKSIAYRYRGRYGNAAYGGGNNSGYGMDGAEWDNFSKNNTETGIYNYDDFNVQVMECEWVDYEEQRHLVYDSVHGRKSVHKLGKDTEIKKLTDKQKDRGAKQIDMHTKMRHLRGAMWIVDTDEVFNHGRVNMADRPVKSEVLHSFRLYSLRDLPITEQLVPIADDLAIAWYRWQDDRASLQRRGYAVDVGMLENIDLGGKDFNFLHVLKAWRDTRYLFHQQSMSGKYEGGTTTPAQPIDSMVLAALEEFIVTWDAALKRIEDVTGINLVMLGATAREGSQVKTTQISAQGTTYVLRPIMKIIGRLRSNMAETAMRRLQLAFKARPDMVKSYADVVGVGDVELLRQAEKDAVQYGLKFEPRASDESKMRVLKAADASVMARRDGKPGLNIGQYMYIEAQIEAGGNLKELGSLIEYMTIKSEQILEQQSREKIELQNQGLADIKQQEQQGETQSHGMELEGDLMKIDREGSWNLAEKGLSPPPTGPAPPMQGPPAGASQPPVEDVSPPGGVPVPSGP